MTTIIEFLTARLNEAEAAARDLDGQEWEDRTGVVMCDRGVVAVGPHGDLDPEESRHIALHDPAYTLRKLEADRCILALHNTDGQRLVGFPRADQHETYCTGCSEPAPCTTLRLLALPFASHIDYQGEWAP